MMYCRLTSIGAEIERLLAIYLIPNKRYLADVLNANPYLSPQDESIEEDAALRSENASVAYAA